MHFDIGGERGREDRHLTKLGALPGETYGGKQQQTAQGLTTPKESNQQKDDRELFWKQHDEKQEQKQGPKKAANIDEEPKGKVDEDTHARWHKRRQPIKITNNSTDVDMHWSDQNSELASAPF
jgi:hypothetical protein